MNIKQRVKTRASQSATFDLRKRVKVLEDEVQECRRLNLRVAELTDLVMELLLPVSQQDEQKVRDLLVRYQDSL
ncbi:DUF6752 domain-containing protein [Nocardioides cavernaquae]|uniref:DUF6752 domain-containing protein n=1 Tax=Nocardioides cavernaquae TaxID=2321396 RepID=A0A3A5HFA7_9ACTN|nr:DUF6752 domain-containing protein [Nocardioides cavernaquae]RJS46650.1 hypothetical protein D4739_10760 [Nocardioides cavernaquae]